MVVYGVFQSTPPVKAATSGRSMEQEGYMISIHAAREGGDITPETVRNLAIISIHAAREGGDYTDTPTDTPADISIHAAREGGDAGT